MLRSSIVLIGSLLWSLLLLGCARVPGGALTPLRPGQLETRVALAEAKPEQADPVEHALALAEAELELGRRDRAASQALQALQRAEMAWRLALMQGDEAAAKDARATLDRVAHQARRLADRTDDPQLMVAAVLADHHRKRHRKALRRAILQGGRPLYHADLPWVTALLHTDDELSWWIGRGLDDDDREWLTLTEERGREGLLEALEAAATREELHQHVVAAAAADICDVNAALLLLALEEIEAGVLAEDPLLLRDLAGRYHAGRDQLARLHLRGEATPGSRALALGLAWWFLDNGMIGDAQGVLEPLEIPGGELGAHLLHRQLVAMTAALRGDVASFERWRVRHDARSPFVDEWLAGFDEDGQGSALRAAAGRARRRRAQPRWPYDRPPTNAALGQAIALDPRLDDRARERVRHWIPEANGEAGAWRDLCRELRRDATTCVALWQHEDVAAGLSLASGTGHLHPAAIDVDALDAAALAELEPMLAPYEGTVLAASPEYQGARLRISLATGDYTTARSRLASHGALLDAYLRTWAWLAIDDLEAGAVTYDESALWVPDFEDEPEEPVEASPPEPSAPLRFDRYVQGMVAAGEGRHADALEHLMPVLDAVPDAVVVEGLAAAALAAHYAGRASVRDDLRVRLHAVDPHGSAYARMQARLALEAGRPDEARSFLAHALRWEPDDELLHRRMVALLAEGTAVPDRPALDFVARTRFGGQYYPLSEQIVHGGLTTLADLDRVRRGIDGTVEDAWAVGPTLLARFPWLSESAAYWGLQKIHEATELEIARDWAAQTLALLEANPPLHEPSRTHRMRLLLLLGRADEALALASTLDRVHGLHPLSENESQVTLLRALEAGEIDDALAWDLWRWSYETDQEAMARVEALLLQPPAGSIMQTFACGELASREDPSPAIPVCAQAFEASPSLVLGVSQSYLALTQLSSEDTGPMALPPDVARAFAAVTAPSFVQAPALALGENLVEPWYVNHALWLGISGQHEAAARSWWQAYAFGTTDDSGWQDVIAQVHLRGPLLRALQGLDDWNEPETLAVDRARLALMGAETRVARAYAEAARARVPMEPELLARAELEMPDRLRHLVDWTERDLVAGRLEPEALPRLVDAVLEPEPRLDAVQSLHARHPEASLGRLALALAYLELDDAKAARPLADELLARHPDDPLAVAVALPLWVEAGDDERARALYQASAAAFPDDLLLRYADVPESITGPRDEVPAWVREPARFDERIARVTDASVDALAPQRQVSTEQALELLVPAGWEPSEGTTLRFDDELGARMLAVVSPRASRCQGADCARDILTALGGEGRTQQWMRQTTLAGLEATQILLTNTEEVVVAWVLPSGGRVFSLMLAAPLSRIDRMRPTVALLRDGFRPLDGVLPPFAAESLRAAGPGVDDGVRLTGRREQSRATAKATATAKAEAEDGTACPVPKTLASLDGDEARAELLVDLWLSTPEASARRALVRCAEPRSKAAGRLALVALLDEDARVHALGRRAVALHPNRVTEDVRTILSTPLTPPVSAPDYLLRSDLPVHGLVEVIGALPASHAGPLADRLARSADLHDRALAWAALELRPELATDAAIDHALADPSPRMVSDAAFLLSERAGPHDAQRLRTRLDAGGPAASEDEQIVLLALALGLATVLDPQDHERLGALPARVLDGDDPKRAERSRKELRGLARDHARALELLREPSPEPGSEDGRALTWRDAQRRRTLPIRPEAELRTKSLAQLLPGHDYVFARLAAPGLFSSTVSDVVERLTTGDEAVDQRLGEMGARMLRESGFEALSRSGGLDTAKPIECARPADGFGWMCTAWVTDREALLAVLGQRSVGEDAGVSLPMTVATTAGVVPLALSLLPAILHPLVYPGDDDEPKGPNADEGAERARMVVVRGSMELERYSIVQARTRRTTVDSERYLFIGDRLWVFSTEDAMERVLRAHEGPTLADSSELSRLTAAWQDGAALQAVALGRAWTGSKRGASVEVVVDETGLRFRYSGAFDSEEGISDISPALAQLPPGAVTSFAHGLGQLGSLELEPLEAEGSDAGRVPPLPVLMATRGLAFGWYLRDGDRLWRRWLAVAPLDDALRKVLRRERITLGPAGKSRRQGALCYARRHGSGPRQEYLLLGDCTLVDEALAGPPPPAPSRDRLRVARGTFDGPAAAAALPGLDGLPLDKRMVLRAVAPLLGVVTDLSVEAHWSPAERVAVLEGHMAMRLRPPGDRDRVIDDWLAASEGHNAASLPRRLRHDEIEAPLRYVIEVPDAEGFVRHTLAESPRVQTDVLGPTRVQLTVSPVPPEGRAPTPLTDKRREELTKRTDTLPIDDPRVAQVARRLAPEGTAPAAAAERIGAWVHERITYEITPRSLDGAQILEAGRGDCTEYARLTVTLLRAAGVPAEMRNGMAASGDELVAHAWVAYHDGERWHEIDPTWGRSMVSAGHLEMSVLDALALVSLGKLKVVEITAP